MKNITMSVIPGDARSCANRCEGCGEERVFRYKEWEGEYLIYRCSCELEREKERVWKGKEEKRKGAIEASLPLFGFLIETLRNDGHTGKFLLFCHSRNLAGNPKAFAEGDFFSRPRREGVPGFPAKRLFGRVGEGGGNLRKRVER